MEQYNERYRRILADPRFDELVRKRGRFSAILSALMLGLYLLFILLIAFAPHLLGTPLGRDTVITWGVPVGVGLILVAIILTGVYVRRANGEFDRLTSELLAEVK
ncbi:DUF485 domain-containing protein [Halotalea alkalilenta]|uniref:DUF485 domain-containing protein n=1 Tax=Halotalea alkalilenta TaxID=376489 RepID=UPI0004860A8F|nr:DUF485 domain-containing protein [Halotalea alkalilenta]